VVRNPFPADDRTLRVRRGPRRGNVPDGSWTGMLQETGDRYFPGSPMGAARFELATFTVSG
jgi:hypothetical protein